MPESEPAAKVPAPVGPAPEIPAPVPPEGLAAEAAAANRLSPEEQLARFEQELKEQDWGHQPC